MDGPLQAIIAAAASFFVVTVAFAVLFALCKKKKGQNQQGRTRTVPNSELSSVAIDETTTFDPSVSQISLQELTRATQNFSPDLIIGDGSFGLVYKACLSTGVTVAVKKLGLDAFQGLREFRAEMETLGKLRHPNIVRILGYCATGWDRVLIYEFIENGSLDQWLLDTSSSETDASASAPRLPLPWETRLNIIKGVAKGLSYMHNLETPIIHRDIKASNVLLDSEFEAHIADFGLARSMEASSSHVSTQMAGTIGYMPPEYLSGAAMATVMGDVYSFGVLMLEVATGIRPNLPFKEEGEGEGEVANEVRLVEWAKKMVEKNRHMEMLDANVSREGLKEAGVVEFFRIATLCSSESWKCRPTMKEVVDLLNRIST